ncbi:hypothetical protein SAMN04488120_10240 [Fontimonas thermophila]|uniref:FimV C-terminal domain-containing protein n=1 Tax=Fontimonas thermophila TaxID=1076937 RepID=A0A1I2HLN6_9GAMM|nr:hypothetical protein [Fontimonas thermophila]SFF30438.1 hypothetical protein SAMN04488120_10240 [Fontimonas thermophila]
MRNRPGHLQFLRGGIAALGVLLVLPCSATHGHSADPPESPAAAPHTPVLHAAATLDSHARLTRRWTTRLIWTLSTDRLPIVANGKTTPPQPTSSPSEAQPDSQVDAALPVVPRRRAADLVTPQCPEQGCTAVADIHLPAAVIQTSPDENTTSSGDTAASAAADSRKLGDWLVLRIFVEKGLLPLLPLLGLAVLAYVLRQRRQMRAVRAVQAAHHRPAPPPMMATHTAPEPTETPSEVIDFALTPAEEAARQHATELAALRERAAALSTLLADPEQRRRLALVMSYLDLGHLVAARALIEEIERIERSAWQSLFSAQ